MKIDCKILIKAERQRQDEKWGVQNHDNKTWLTILMEEVGEAAQETLRDDPELVMLLVEEIVQVAAVAEAWLESIARNLGGANSKENIKLRNRVARLRARAT